MSKIRSIIFLFILLVVTITSGFYFSSIIHENFTSSSEKNRGQGIGDIFAAPLDLPLNTDNTRFYGLSQIPTNM